MKEYGDELFIYAMALQQDEENEDAEDEQDEEQDDEEHEDEEHEDEEQVEDLFDKITKDIERLLNE